MEKIGLFSRAKYTAGSFSSDFAEIKFGKSINVVLILITCSRHEDMYLTKISKLKNINLEYFLGVQNNYYSDESNFSNDIDHLSECLFDKWGMH